MSDSRLRPWFCLGLCLAAWLLLACQTSALHAQSRKSPGTESAPPHGSVSGTSLLSPSSTRAIDDLVESSIAARKLPGAVVVIGHEGRIVFDKAYGVGITQATVFDMASMTKVLVTAPAVMQLYEQGRLQLDDPVAKYLPEFAQNGKRTITIRQLLTHSSGLAADLPLAEPWSGKEEGFRRAFASAPTSPPGAEFRYSDINYIVLGVLVEKLSGLPLDEYASRYIFRPMGLADTRFLPPAAWRSRIAPTELDKDGKNPPGLVNDPTARRMGGVAGHAGLFSTANDVAIYAQNLLDRLQGRPSRFPLKRATLERMIGPVRIPGRSRVTLRGLGWDIDSVYSSPRGTLFPVGSFGHTGFTGTSLWIDPASESYVIILSNAVYPKGHTDLRALRSGIATYAAAALGAHASGGKAAVQTGIDVLEEDHFAELAELARKHGGGLRIGLLTNQTGMDSRGERTADVLAHDAPAAVPGLTLKLLFSPEHGISGTLDKEDIANSTDPATGLPVISLYGATDAQRRPPADTLRQLDAVVIDLQDAGVRFYTYETLVRYFLEEAGRTHTEIVVLDRPNPISGVLVQGPLSDPGRESYVDAMPIPVRHGMTLGELARYFNGEGKLGAPLAVVAMRGWQREDWFDETGLTWVNPSPNLRSLAATTLYPALGLIETTNVSVGRGTETPFAFVGAPWIEASSLAHFLTARSIPGVSFEPVRFVPAAPYPFANQPCQGVRIAVTDRDAADMPELGLEIASAVQDLFRTRFELAKMDWLLVNRTVLDALVSGRDPRQIAEDWRKSLQVFETARQRYLLY
jgi:uncharacterized protein YbbC (DUF1343 family)/CubicO group peptidase (beta-lactamase class C family)